MKRLRIRPEIWARTTCLLGSSTRNMVPARTDLIVPSSSIASCCFMVVAAGVPFAERRRRKMPSLAAGTGEIIPRAFFASARFVNGQAPALQLGAVDGVHRSGRGDRVRHRDKAEAAG